MTILANQVGLDIAQSFLDIQIAGQPRRTLANNYDGIMELIGLLPEEAIIHMEASGGHDRLVRRLLKQEGFTSHRHNPRKVRRIADAFGVSAKTDALDAYVLSRAGHILPEPVAKSAQKEALCDISRTIEDLQKDRSDWKRRLKTPELAPQAKAAANAVIDFLDAQIENLKKEFLKMVRQSDSARAYKLALSVRNIGPDTARVLICELPDDLTPFSLGQICSYGGIAPMDDSSGKRTNEKRIRPGNMHLKACLYMPAIGAISRDPWAKDLYARLKAKGKKHQQAAVAVMRRLLRHAIAVLKRGTPWQIQQPTP